ncbi:MAG: DoxX family membrane protein [Propionibacteriaceae bacterium]|nr:DoxX family membrane protein [Propionibacteriaceae bacterium]
MSEQPENDTGDDTAEPTRTWAPPADGVRAKQPEDIAAESFEEEAPGTAEAETSLITQDEPETLAEPRAPEPDAEPTSVLPEPEPEPSAAEPASFPPEPEPAAVEPEPEPLVPEPAAVEPEPLVPEPAAVEPEIVVPAALEPDELEVTAPTTPIGLSETVALPTEAPTPEPTQANFRDSPTEAIPDPYADPLSEEAQKLAAERAARKEARDAALAAVAPPPVATPEPVVIKQRTNDKFFGSLGIFLLRLVVAGIFGIRGYQMLGDLAATQERFAATLLAPYAQILAIVVGSIHLLIALALILGLLTRVAGLGVALVAGGALAFVWWGPWSPFVAGQSGFLGELELLLVTVGLLLLVIGGGGWSIDRSFRSARAKDKAARQLAP